MEQTFSVIVEQPLQQQTAVDRVLGFCRTYEDVSQHYLFIKDRMAEQSTEQPGAQIPRQIESSPEPKPKT